jgi:glycosyltransferase involved in cell wall biosynthesis
MKISVAIPCYNGAAYVGRAIESILEQTHPASEILVVDDGSTDSSAAIVKSYPVTLLPHAANQGLAAARNTAIQAAGGEILLFMDVDAYAAPDLIEVLMTAYAGGNEHLGGVGGQGIESNIRSIADRWRRAHASQGHGSTRKYVPHLFGLCMSYRLVALRRLGGFDTAFRTNAEDIDLGLRLTAAGFELLYLPEARVFHQRTDDTASLKRAMAAWYGAAYHARQQNNAQPWRLFAGTLRRVVADPVKDVFVWRAPVLVPLSITLSGVKLRALWQAARLSRRLQNR